MEILLTPEQWVLDLYPDIIVNSTYVMSKYLIKVEINDRIILLHTITWAIYDLSKQEYNEILDNNLLMLNKVVIPKDLDENIIANTVYIKRMTFKDLPSFETINSCVIFTTTACNARCAYCYENNIDKKETMTLSTAEKIVQFLCKRHKNKKTPLKIQWFGGEPLLNQTVIDYIVDRLNESEISFYSTIISNSYLLNENTINKLEKWKLKTLQVTIDGIGDEYNKVKNYIYSDVDAFMTVIENIHNVLEKTSVNVNIRLNVSNENIFHMYDTIEYLKDEFKDYLHTNKLYIYVAPIFEIRNNETNGINGYWEEIERIKQIANVPEVSMCDIELNSETFKRKQINKSCLAFNGKSVVILPNGDLAPCEHVKKEDIYGNVEDGFINIDVVKKWYTFDGPQIDFCKNNNCPLQPICPRFFNCDENLICNNNTTNLKRIKKAQEKLIRTYNFYYNQK